jgi:flagellar P-ring protein precursor FlgI
MVLRFTVNDSKPQASLLATPKRASVLTRALSLALVALLVIPYSPLSIVGDASARRTKKSKRKAPRGERIKDIAHLRGVRSNQLFGYGIVVGLNRSGDSQQVRFATQTVASLLARLNVRINPQGLLLRNIATVMVTAELPPFARNGNRVDVVVSSMGDAKSLSGGSLIATALRGHDGRIYAMAQGPLSVGGYTVSGGGGGTKIKNHPTVGRVPSGAIIEREVSFEIKDKEVLRWQLFEDDFTTAVRVAQEVNFHFGRELAIAEDSRTVVVKVPQFAPPIRAGVRPTSAPDPDAEEDFRQEGHVARFIAQVERIPVIPDTVAKVIVNERTGTVIINQDVRVDPIAITHGNITVKVTQENQVVPASPFSSSGPATQTNTDVEVEEERANIALLDNGHSLRDLIDGLNQLGASPRDLITILQAIKRAGALRAKLEVI